MANVFGLPYRILIALLGLVITMLSITGVYLSVKKRRAKAIAHGRRRGPVHRRPPYCWADKYAEGATFCSMREHPSVDNLCGTAYSIGQVRTLRP